MPEMVIRNRLRNLILLPNGNYMFTVNDPQTVDMSQLVPGRGSQVNRRRQCYSGIGSGWNVVFQWNSFDYLPITDFGSAFNC